MMEITLLLLNWESYYESDACVCKCIYRYEYMRPVTATTAYKHIKHQAKWISWRAKTCAIHTMIRVCAMCVCSNSTIPFVYCVVCVLVYTWIESWWNITNERCVRYMYTDTASHRERERSTTHTRFAFVSVWFETLTVQVESLHIIRCTFGHTWNMHTVCMHIVRI